MHVSATLAATRAWLVLHPSSWRGLGALAGAVLVVSMVLSIAVNGVPA